MCSGIVGLICISLVTNDVQHLFLYLFAFCICSCDMLAQIFCSLCFFSYWVLKFLYMLYIQIYILVILSQSVVWFSVSEQYLLKKYLILIKYNLSVYSLYGLYFCCCISKSLSKPRSQRCSPMLSGFMTYI